MNAKPREEWLQTFSLKLSVELCACRPARKSCPAGPLDVVRLWIWCVPEHHHRVTNKLVDCSAFGEERLCKRGKIARRLVHENVGVGGLGDRRKIPDVGENDGNLLSDSAELGGDGIVNNPLDDLLRDKVRKRPYGALCEPHCAAKFVNFFNARCDWQEVRRSQLLQRNCLSGDASQG